jgi:hypothetical protein
MPPTTTLVELDLVSGIGERDEDAEGEDDVDVCKEGKLEEGNEDVGTDDDETGKEEFPTIGGSSGPSGTIYLEFRKLAYRSSQNNFVQTKKEKKRMLTRIL